ncbi:MAG: DUF4870 domain-containing protein [Bacillota bacterium]|jgi:uncharacterized Tic20 family protein
MEDQRVLSILTHILGLFTGFIGPLVIFLIADETKPFAKAHAKESLNFQITVLLGLFVSFILTFILIGILGFIVISIVDLIFCIMAAVAASNNQEYRYPVSIRFIR